MTKKGKARASADVGLIFVAYNLRRIMNILDKNVFKKFLQELCFFVFAKPHSQKDNKVCRLIPIFENLNPGLFLKVA